MTPVLPQVVGLGAIVSSIYSYALSIVGLAVFIMFIYAGLQYINPLGGADNIRKARQAMADAVIGTILLFSAYVILNTINQNLVASNQQTTQGQ